MIALLQRVAEAEIRVAGVSVARVGHGLLVYVAFEVGDGATVGRRLLTRILGYRLFEDATGRMSRSVLETQGGLLVVPQFTLAAATSQGLRPDFARVLARPHSAQLWSSWLEDAGQVFPDVQSGVFGADMQIASVQDGPATFWLRDS